MMKRPPIGIPPRFIVNEFRSGLTNQNHIIAFDFARFIAVKEALFRYRDEPETPIAWAAEYVILRDEFLYHSIAKQ